MPASSDPLKIDGMAGRDAPGEAACYTWARLWRRVPACPWLPGTRCAPRQDSNNFQHHAVTGWRLTERSAMTAPTESREQLIKRLEANALQIRKDIWRACRASGTGHMGGSLSAAEFLAALYFHTMKVCPNESDWADRDRFILSKGSANAGLAAVLAQAGSLCDSYFHTFHQPGSGFGLHRD